jgi:hypothetical protein
MLDAYIIEELKRREKERQREDRKRPTLEIPVQERDESDSPRHSEREERSDRGVVQVQL